MPKHMTEDYPSQEHPNSDEFISLTISVYVSESVRRTPLGPSEEHSRGGR